MRVEIYGCPINTVQGNAFHYYFNENYSSLIVHQAQQLKIMAVTVSQ